MIALTSVHRALALGHDGTQRCCPSDRITAKDSGEEPLMRTVSLKRTPLIRRRALIWCLACCVTVLLAPAGAAQGGRLEIGYTVKVADIPGQLFHVTTEIRNIKQPAL